MTLLSQETPNVDDQLLLQILPHFYEASNQPAKEVATGRR